MESRTRWLLKYVAAIEHFFELKGNKNLFNPIPRRGGSILLIYPILTDFQPDSNLPLSIPSPLALAPDGGAL